MRYLLILVLFFFVLPQTSVRADSLKAYQDYLFQSDQYRRALSEFTIAKNEYEKFKSLTSETDALEKTKLMLSSRDRFLRSYLLLLIEKLIENPGVGSSTRALYISLLGNEVAFLEGHSALVPSIASLSDAQTVSQKLESHYNVLQVSMYQTITALTLGNLNSLALSYDAVVSQAQKLALGKGATTNRWLLQIQNKRSLYQQKVDTITRKNNSLPGSDQNELSRQSIEIGEEAAGAKQYLVEGTSYLKELVTALKYE